MTNYLSFKAERVAFAGFLLMPEFTLMTQKESAIHTYSKAKSVSFDVSIPVLVTIQHKWERGQNMAIHTTNTTTCLTCINLYWVDCVLLLEKSTLSLWPFPESVLLLLGPRSITGCVCLQMMGMYSVRNQSRHLRLLNEIEKLSTTVCH